MALLPQTGRDASYAEDDDHRADAGVDRLAHFAGHSHLEIPDLEPVLLFLRNRNEQGCDAEDHEDQAGYEQESSNASFHGMDFCKLLTIAGLSAAHVCGRGSNRTV